MNRNLSVYGLFETRTQLEAATVVLRENGFSAEDISVLFPENVGDKHLAVKAETKAPEAATAGGATGAVIGGTLGWLAGIGILAIPGLGPFIAAGPIMAALAGLGTGATIGGIAGGLIGMGLPEYEAKRYEGRVRDGNILISVHCGDDAESHRAETILKESGASDISTTSEVRTDRDGDEPPVATGAINFL